MPLYCTTLGWGLAERRVDMPKKSPKSSTAKEVLEGLEPEEVMSSMMMYVNSEGDRVYMHPFDTEPEALEFLEVMAAGLRADIFETLLKRSVN